MATRRYVEILAMGHEGDINETNRVIRILGVLSTLPNLHAQLSMFTHFVMISEHCLVNITSVEKLSLLKLTMKDRQSFSVSPLELPKVKKALRESAP